MTSELVTKQANGPYYRETANKVDKPGYVYLYNINGVLIIQAKQMEHY